jgi:hypothetical protein
MNSDLLVVTEDVLLRIGVASSIFVGDSADSGCRSPLSCGYCYGLHR